MASRTRQDRHARGVVTLSVLLSGLTGLPALVPQPAGATGPTRLANVSSIAADGVHTAVLWDMRRGMARIVKDRQPLAGGLSVTSPAGCAPAGVSTGRVLFSCPDPAAPDNGAAIPFLYDIRSRSWQIPAAAQTMLDSQRQQLATDGGETSSFAFTALGARLALFHTEGRHGSSDAMVDLTTGIGVPPSRSPREYHTLDAKGGHAGLCTPVRRTARRIEEPYTGSTTQLQAVLQVSGWTVRWWPATALAPARRVILQRCGQRQSRKLTKRASFFGPVLTRRYVAWLQVSHTKQPKLCMRMLHSGRTLVYQLPRSNVPGGGYRAVAGTRHRVFLTSGSEQPAARFVSLSHRHKVASGSSC